MEDFHTEHSISRVAGQPFSFAKLVGILNRQLVRNDVSRAKNSMFASCIPSPCLLEVDIPLWRQCIRYHLPICPQAVHFSPNLQIKLPSIPKEPPEFLEPVNHRPHIRSLSKSFQPTPPEILPLTSPLPTGRSHPLHPPSRPSLSKSQHAEPEALEKKLLLPSAVSQP